MHIENVLKMSWIHLCNMYWRRFEDVLKTSWQHIFKTSWRRLKSNWRRIEDVWSRRIYSSWSRRLLQMYEEEDERRVQGVFKTSSSRQIFAGVNHDRNWSPYRNNNVFFSNHGLNKWSFGLSHLPHLKFEIFIFSLFGHQNIYIFYYPIDIEGPTIAKVLEELWTFLF